MFLDLEQYYTELGGAKGPVFRRNFFYRCDESLLNTIQAFKEEYNYTDCFQCLYKYSSLDTETPLLYAPFYLDLDADITSEKKFKKIIPDVARAYLGLMSLGLKPEEIELYFSGSKGFHIVVDPRILGIVPSTELNAIYKAWALYLSHIYAISIIDLRIYDKRRLFRIPNTINSKTGLYKVPVSLQFLYDHTYDDLMEYATSPKNEKEPVYKINRTAALRFYQKSKQYKKSKVKNKEVSFEIPETKQELLPCVQTILREGAIKGARNNTLIVLASCLLQSGYTMAEVNKIAIDWNELNEPPLHSREIMATVNSAYAMLQNGRRYGCASIRDLGLCSSNEGRLGENHVN